MAQGRVPFPTWLFCVVREYELHLHVYVEHTYFPDISLPVLTSLTFLTCGYSD